MARCWFTQRLATSDIVFQCDAVIVLLVFREYIYFHSKIKKNGSSHFKSIMLNNELTNVSLTSMSAHALESINFFIT